MLTLKTRADFLRLRNNVVFSNNAIMIQRGKNKDGVARVGFTATKKFSKLAVDRNTAKRRMREIANKLPLKNGFDYVFIAKTSLKDCDFNALLETLKPAI